MAEALAAVAADLLALELLVDRVDTCLFHFLGALLVFLELTASGVVASLSAAPPHLATPLRLVRAARPIEVFTLVEVLSAVLTNQKPLVETAASLLQLADEVFELLTLLQKLAVLVFKLVEAVNLAIALFRF